MSVCPIEFEKRLFISLALKPARVSVYSMRNEETIKTLGTRRRRSFETTEMEKIPNTFRNRKCSERSMNYSSHISYVS